jgi:hypothetical protein
MKKIVLPIVVIAFPYTCCFLAMTVSWGLIPLAIETLYFFPISWVGEPLFRSVESGIIVPSHFGRLVGVGTYLVLLWGAVSFARLKRGYSENS